MNAGAIWALAVSAYLGISVAAARLFWRKAFTWSWAEEWCCCGGDRLPGVIVLIGLFWWVPLGCFAFVHSWHLVERIFLGDLMGKEDDGDA